MGLVQSKETSRSILEERYLGAVLVGEAQAPRVCV